MFCVHMFLKLLTVSVSVCMSVCRVSVITMEFLVTSSRVYRSVKNTDGADFNKTEMDQIFHLDFKFHIEAYIDQGWTFLPDFGRPDQ